MHADSSISSPLADRADGMDGNRQPSTQEAGLLRWLQAKAQPAISEAPGLARSAVPDLSFPRPSVGDKVRTLRQALAAEGLDILPDPLHRFPCQKVIRAKRPPRG